MKQIIAVTLLMLAMAGCGPSRMEQLRSAARPYDEAKALAALPQGRDVDMSLQVTDRVLISTSMGDVVVGLFGQDAPVTVKNFLSYVNSGFYSGTIFHRVISGFIIQGGGYNEELEKMPTGTPIPLEIIPGLQHQAGTISMARTDDPASATSQFFICVNSAVQLNGEYAAFGVVEEGLDVVQHISMTPTQSQEGPMGVMDDVPVTPVVIKAVKRL